MGYDCNSKPSWEIIFIPQFLVVDILLSGMFADLGMDRDANSQLEVRRAAEQLN